MRVVGAAVVAMLLGLIAAAACSSFTSNDTTVDAGPDAIASPPPTDAPSEGGCTGSACEAIVENEKGVSIVLVSNADLYWAVPNAIRWCTGTPCAAQTVAQLSDRAVGIEVDVSAVYWAAGSALAWAPRTPPFATNNLVNVTGTISGITRAGSTVLYGNAQGVAECIRTSGCTSGAVIGGQVGALAFGAVGDDVYVVVSNSEVFRVSPPGLAVGGRVVFATGPISALAASDTSLFWAVSGASGALFSAPATAVDAGSPAPLADAIDEPWSIATDTANVYVSSYGAGEVIAVPRGGGPKRIVASGLSQPKGLAVDAEYVYVAESGAGRILRIPIPK
jgi:hypothetical protein